MSVVTKRTIPRWHSVARIKLGYDEYNEVSETGSIQDIATLPEQARATSKTWTGLPVEESVIFFYYAAFNAPCVGHKDDESQARGSRGRVAVRVIKRIEFLLESVCSDVQVVQ